MILNNDKIAVLLNELSLFSKMTYEHSVNVSNIASSFAQEIGLDDETIEKLIIAALLHDIGKLKIPYSILHKSSKLTNEEFEIIKKHSKYGVDLLVNKGFCDNEILDIILCHHERIDGLGYPNGIKGDSIPKLAKIITICDCYDAMRSPRSYSESHDIEYIKNEFLKNSGTQFDPYYTSLFLNYLDKTIQKSK